MVCQVLGISLQDGKDTSFSLSKYCSSLLAVVLMLDHLGSELLWVLHACHRLILGFCGFSFVAFG